MTEPHDPLAELWTRTEAPARDLEFELAVEEAISRRQIALDGALWVGGVGVGGAVLAAAWPGLESVARSLAAPFASAAPVFAITGAMVLLALWLSNAAFDTER